MCDCRPDPHPASADPQPPGGTGWDTPGVTPAAAPHAVTFADATDADVARRSGTSGAYILMATVAKTGIFVVSTAILARMLDPAAFGLFAMAATVLGLTAMFQDFGTTRAAVKSRSTDPALLGGLFWRNLQLTGLLCLTLVGTSPLVAWFYGHRELIFVMAGMLPGVAISGAAAIHLGLFRRSMRFGVLASVDVGSTLAGAVAAVAVAYAGAGFWALVVQQAVTGVVQGTTLWAISPWRPMWPRACVSRHDPELAGLLKFGRHATWARVLNTLGYDVDKILVGRLAGDTALGLYQKSVQWAAVPGQRIQVSLTNVAVSTFTRLHDDATAPDVDTKAAVARYRSAVRQVFLLLWSYSIPITVLVAVAAEEAVLLLFGDGWLDAVPLLQVLAVAAAVQNIPRLTKWIYLSEGQTGRQVKWTLMWVGALATSASVGIVWGVQGVATGYMIATIGMAVPSWTYCLRDTVLRPRDVASAAWRPVICTAVAAGVAVLLRQMPLPDFSFYRGSVVAGAYFASFAAAWFALPGGVSTFREMAATLKLLKSKKGKRRKHQKKQDANPVA